MITFKQFMSEDDVDTKAVSQQVNAMLKDLMGPVTAKPASVTDSPKLYKLLDTAKRETLKTIDTPRGIWEIGIYSAGSRKFARIIPPHSNPVFYMIECEAKEVIEYLSEQLLLSEAAPFKLKSKVKIVSGPKDVIGKEGFIGEIRKDVTGRKKYTVDYDYDDKTGFSKSIQLTADNLRNI